MNWERLNARVAQLGPGMMFDPHGTNNAAMLELIDERIISKLEDRVVALREGKEDLLLGDDTHDREIEQLEVMLRAVGAGAGTRKAYVTYFHSLIGWSGMRLKEGTVLDEVDRCLVKTGIAQRIRITTSHSSYVEWIREPSASWDVTE